MPRGLTAPALSGPVVRTFTGETATCAIHERSFTRAAGVSPPWVGNRTCNGDRFSRSDYVDHARSDGSPAAGLRQPLLVHDIGPLKNNDIRDVQTHVLQERRPSARRGLVTGRACRA
jgi:hypothetical protein